MQKIKILRIISRLNIGGPAIHTVLLTEGLDKERFESLLVCGSVSPDEGDMRYYALEKNVIPIDIPELQRELNLPKDIRALFKLFGVIKSQGPDIIHTHTAKAGALGRSAAILYNLIYPGKKIRLVHTFHGHIFEGYFSGLKTNIFVIIEKILARFTDKLLTVSNTVKKELIRLGIGKDELIEVMPLGLELDSFLHIPPRPPSDEFVVGIVGRLVPIKNHRLFIQAAQKFIRQHPSVKIKFKVVGDGQLRKELEALSIELEISDVVDFLGWQKDLPVVYEHMDIVVLTSLNEGTPVSLIEAMAAGRAVVATDVGGVKELLGEGKRGILVQSEDGQGLADAYDNLLKNYEQRLAIAVQAREYARETFSKERLFSDIERLYLQLVML